jgi:GNAT superfamily N-acetyltransferase
MTFNIRPIEGRDEKRWRELWEGYCRFYERAPDEAITRRTWERIRDSASPIHSIVADRNRVVVGIANYVLHETTLAIAPACYLQDLFVDPNERSIGVGKGLIDWLVAEMAARGWARLYWNTRETNYRARGLYDKYGPHSGFVRYVLKNTAAS